jgi:hypothetical protein
MTNVTMAFALFQVTTTLPSYQPPQPISHHFSDIYRLPSWPRITLSQVFFPFIPHATTNKLYSRIPSPLSSSRRFTPYDIQPRLTYKTPLTRPTHKRTPTRITLTQLNPFITYLGVRVFFFHSHVPRSDTITKDARLYRRF